MATESDALNGAWRLVSAQVRMEDNGDTVDVQGPIPSATRSSSRVGGRCSSSRRWGAHRPDDAAAAAHHRSMTAHTGRYRIEGDQVVTTVDGAWQPGWEGSEQRRYFTLGGDMLTLKTPVQEHPSHPGRMHRGIFEWARERR
jgi:hypothetical protein